jgi:hypothetical protein
MVERFDVIHRIYGRGAVICRVALLTVWPMSQAGGNAIFELDASISSATLTRYSTATAASGSLTGPPLRSSNTNGIAASARIIRSLKSLT